MKLQLTVPDMACGACADAITKAIQTLDTAAKVTADTDTKVVEIETSAAEASVKSAVEQAGYTIA